MVEDSELDAALMTRELKSGGYDVVTERVDTEQAFLAALESKLWDLILCDYRMPEFNGLAALQLFRARNLDIPFIMVSAVMGEELVVEAMKGGAHDYLMKAHLNRLVPAVERQINDAAVRREGVRTTQALREIEIRYRSLFENMSEGYAYCKMLFEDNKPTDFIYMDVNAKFAELTGLKDVVEKTVSEVIPGIQESNPELFECYGRVALTGKPEKLETYVGPLGIWFSVSVYSPGREYFVAVFENVTERRQAEESLRESEERYRALFTFSPDALYVHVDGCVTLVNPAMCKLLGTDDPSLLIGKSVHEIVHPEYHEKLRQRWNMVFGGQPAPLLEEKFIRLDGTLVDVEVSAVAIDWEGSKAVQVIARDITERKRADEALTYERNLLKSLMDNIPDHVYFKDNESRFLRMSRSQANRFGLEDPAQAVGKTDFEFFAEEHARTAHEDEQQIMKSGIAIIGIEEKESWPDGSESWVSTTKVPLQDAQGQIIGTFGISRDITERKRVEESLIRLNKAVEASGEVIFMTDRNGIFSFVNTSFTTLYGYEKAEVVGKTTPRILKSGRQLPDHYTEFWHALINKQTIKADLINRTKDGRLLTIEATANPILDTKGSIIGFLAIQRDVTQQRTLEEQIRQSQKMESLGTLASGIAHDFNNILSIILGHASLIEKYQYDPERFRDSLQTITNASTRGASLVRQMLTFARKSATEFRPLLINESIQEIQRLLHETFPKTITVAFDVAERLPLITADATQIHQVLLNLCVNARDAMDGKGTLTVSARLVRGETVRHRFVNAKSSTYIEVTVADTGIGMDETTRHRIFEPFFTTKQFGKGTGLGLAVVFGIMESHSGFIDVASEVGRGTTFSLYFPIKSFSVESVNDKSIIQKEAAGGTEVILVVEDEETLKESVRLILTANGYTVLSAEDGEQGIAMLDRFHNDIALVICDLGLPKFSGLEVLKKLKTLNPGVKFILGTGYIDPAERTAVLREGANDIVLKPYITNEFLRRVRDVLDAK